MLFIGTPLLYARDDTKSEYSWRYRITVEIETPEGIKIGSSVRDVTIHKQSYGWSNVNKEVYNSYQKELDGEAVVVNLGERGVVFSLIQFDDYQEVPLAFGIKTYNEVSALPIGSKAQVTKNIPWFVTFKDINDPLSVTLVRGGAFNKETQSHDPVRNFEKYFGEGVRLKTISVEIVDLPVTWGLVDKYLPENFQENIMNRWRELPMEVRKRIGKLTRFKHGEK